MPRCQSSEPTNQPSNQPVVVRPFDKLAILSLTGYAASSVLDRAVADRFFCARSVPLRNFPRPVYRSSTRGLKITAGAPRLAARHDVTGWLDRSAHFSIRRKFDYPRCERRAHRGALPAPSSGRIQFQQLREGSERTSERVAR